MYSIIARTKTLKGRHEKLPRLLVTGCAGSIGKMMQSAFTAVFDYDVVGVDRHDRIQPNIAAINDIHGTYYHKFDYIYENDKFVDLLKNDKKIQKVAHLAEVSREEANLDYNLAKKYNVEGTKLLVQNIKENCDLSKMHIFFRSDMSVYGDRRENPSIKTTDTPKPNPQDYYALTKLEAENVIKESGIPYTIMRFAPICDHKTWWVDLHPSFFYFELDQTIEWITGRDAAKAIKQGIYKSEQIDKQIYNIGGGSKLVIRHRDFMKQIMNARGVMIEKPIDLEPKAFANINLYGGYYEDSDYSNSVLGYRMQPIDTAYLRQKFRYPFIYRWINQRIPYKYIIESHYEAASHIYQSVLNEDEEFLAKFFDKNLLLPKEKVLENLENSIAIEKDERDLKKRQLRNAMKKADADFIEACKQAEIKENIEKKWRVKRQELIAKGENPDIINLDEVEKLEAEDIKRQEEMGGKIEEEPEKKELTEEEKIRLQELEEEEREQEKRTFGY